MEHDIVGINEIAAMAGVTSQAVTNWRSRATDFPRPLRELASGPIFRRSQVRAWLKRNNRKLVDLKQTSSFYARLKSYRNDDDALSNCISRVIASLEANKTSGSN